MTTMADPNSPLDDERPASSSQTRSTAQQVEYWVRWVSLLAALSVIGAWWTAAAPSLTASTAFIVLFATIGLWTTVHRLLILGIKQLVKNRIA